jgi:hypothetical protein
MIRQQRCFIDLLLLSMSDPGGEIPSSPWNRTIRV